MKTEPTTVTTGGPHWITVGEILCIGHHDGRETYMVVTEVPDRTTYVMVEASKWCLAKDWVKRVVRRVKFEIKYWKARR